MGLMDIEEKCKEIITEEYLLSSGWTLRKLGVSLTDMQICGYESDVTEIWIKAALIPRRCDVYLKTPKYHFYIFDPSKNYLFFNDKWYYADSIFDLEFYLTKFKNEYFGRK